jgi:hypothetical protein
MRLSNRLRRSLPRKPKHSAWGNRNQRKSGVHQFTECPLATGTRAAEMTGCWEDTNGEKFAFSHWALKPLQFRELQGCQLC